MLLIAACAAARDAAVFGRTLPSNAAQIKRYIKTYQGYQVHLDSILVELHKTVDGLQEGLFQRKLSNEIAESIYTQEEIRQIFRRGDQKEIEDFLSNHGKRRLARNTGLLTQYDRKGVIVGINSSDQDLILHGNKNQIKL